VTKSGTSAWHGDAFYYNRNSGTGANDAIDKAAGNPRPLNVLQQFGADLGGPLLKNRLFFYFDYEQQRQKTPLYVSGTQQSTVDETSFGVPAGTVLAAANSHFPVASLISPAMASANPLDPRYLQGVANALNEIHSNIGPRARRRDDLEFFPKVDWQLTAKDHLTFLYNYNTFNSPGGIITFSPEAFAGIEALGNNGVRDHVGLIHWIRAVSPTVVNDMHVGVVRDEQLYTPSGLVDPSAPLVQLIQPQYMALGNETFSYNNQRESQWQFADHVSWQAGKHLLEFGFDFNHDRSVSKNPGPFIPQYTFLSLQNFALGKWDIFTQGTGNAVFDFSDPFYGYYINDTIHALAKLTISAGIREDFQVFPNPKGNPLLPFSNVFHNQFQRVSPRLGLSYALGPKTVVRGGIGLYYEIFEGANFQNSTQNNGVLSQSASISLYDIGNANSVASAQPVVFPSHLPEGYPGYTSGSNITVIAPNFKTPSILNSNLQVEQEVAPRTVLTVGSMWSHGMHLLSSTAYDMNLLPPTGTTTYLLPNGGSVTGPNLDSGRLKEGALTPSLGQINALISPGINNYISFFTSLNRQMSGGLSSIVSYTLSKATQTGVDFYNQFDLKQTAGLSLLDQRHRLSVALLYAPHVSFENAKARAALANWEVSLLSQFNSGHPYSGLLNPAANGNYLNDTAALQTTANSAAGLAARGLSPGEGINSFTGPWITEIDLGLARHIHITEKFTITLKAQMFNLFNSANYFVQSGSGINQYQYNATGSSCGDGVSLNQVCTLAPAPGFRAYQSVAQTNPPRIAQFSFGYSF
jgi:hypothetical protein